MKKLFILLIFNISQLVAQPLYDLGNFSIITNPQRCFTALDNQSNFYLSGNFSGSANIDPSNSTYSFSSNGQQDFFIVKYNQTGSIEWVTTLGGLGTENIHEMELDNLGNIYITGFFNSNSFDTGLGGVLTTTSNGTNTFVIKISAINGSTLWAKTFQGTSSTTNVAFGYGLDIDNNNNAIVSGSFSGTIDFDPSSGVQNRTSQGDYDIFVAKFNTSGNLEWVNTYGGTNFENGFKVHCDYENNIILIGSFFSSTLDFDPNGSAGIITHNSSNVNSNDAFLTKLSSSGSFIWAFQFSTATFSKITTDTQGNIFCVGNFSGTTDFNPIEATFNLTSIGTNDAFTLKVNSSGALNWVKQLGKTSFNGGISVALDIFGNVYTVGGFSGENVDFDPGVGTSNLSSLGGIDFFIQKLNTNGEYIWAVSSGSSLIDFARDISIDGNGKCYIVGTMQGISGDIDPTSSIDNRAGSGFFFIRLSNFTNTNPGTNNAVVVASTLSDNGNNIPVVFQDQSGVISAVTPSGSNPVVGQLTAKVWINTSGIDSYINKNYEITPEINPNTATGRVTIYFTQSEFDTYNSTNPIDLPSGPTDALGISNIKIDKYAGTSSDNSGTPASYGTTPTIIDPNDDDIVWNGSLNRWEISFDVTGFSGFFMKGFTNPCVAILILSSTNSPSDDISGSTIIKEANATTGTILASNKILNKANVTYRTGKSISLEPGFKADNGVIFKTEFGGCN